jgi:DNA damage-binding protein 1
MCPFNAESFPDCLALVTDKALSIGTIDEIQKLHIRSVPLGEMPRRIAHHEASHVFCVLTQRNLDTEEEANHLRLYDEHTFERTCLSRSSVCP